jgi:hypothetical protein
MGLSKTLLAGAAIALATALGATQASATNNGFETGDLTGWTLSGGGGAATAYGAFTPAEGKYLGFVEAGCGAGVDCVLSQTFSLSAGEKLTGDVGFQANDYLPFNDFASLQVNGTPIFSSDVAAVGDFGNTGWQSFSFTAPSAGSYTLSLHVANDLDNALSSGAVLDGVKAGVPEPATWAMMLIGLGGLGAMARNRRRAGVAA